MKRKITLSLDEDLVFEARKVLLDMSKERGERLSLSWLVEELLREWLRKQKVVVV